MAIFRIITFLIHAIAAAIAGLAVAILTHLVPMLLVGLAGAAAVLLLCTSCGIRGLEFFRRRKENE